MNKLIAQGNLLYNGCSPKINLVIPAAIQRLNQCLKYENSENSTQATLMLECTVEKGVIIFCLITTLPELLADDAVQEDILSAMGTMLKTFPSIQT